jgi:predicted  nucleic acid-binding Zn ribbon protein
VFKEFREAIMFTAELVFVLNENRDSDSAVDSIYSLLGALRLNGQILGREFPLGQRGLTYRCFVLIPESNSLDEGLANKYVKKELTELEEVGLYFSYEIVGEEPECAPVCKCHSPSSYILFTHYVSLESPLRCGDCFGVVPLYKIPYTYDDEYYDIIIWTSDYQACDSLQMNCSTGERFGTQQISRHDSSLSKRGIEICSKISKVTGIKTYYYLYRNTSLGRNAELNRKCPSCGGEWLIDNPLHDKFDFCCNKCSLLSNISWSVR